MKTDWKMLAHLFWAFCKMGPVTFGGGYAMLPLIQQEIADKRNWLPKQELSNLFAVAGSVPGALAVNAATLIGFRLGGIIGAILATIGMFLPAFVIVLIFSVCFFQLKGNPRVEAAFEGIRAGTVALIAYAGYQLSKTSILDKTTLLLAGLAILLLFFLHVHPVVMILGGAAAGVLLVSIKDRLGLVTRLEPRERKKDLSDPVPEDDI